MAVLSGLIRVMEKAARKAGGRLRRDLEAAHVRRQDHQAARMLLAPAQDVLCLEHLVYGTEALPQNNFGPFDFLLR